MNVITSINDTLACLKRDVNNMKDDVENLTTTQQQTGSAQNPAASCRDILKQEPDSTSKYYWIRDSSGRVTQQYCDMEREGCGTRGGWMRVAHLDMTQPNQQCPPGFRLITDPKRLCGRPGPPGCVSVKFSTNGITYNKVCGKVIGYRDKSTDGVCPYIGAHAHPANAHRINTIEEAYLDGVSITYGHPNPRQHIWSFISALDIETYRGAESCHCCPCYENYAGTFPPFVENNYFCDTGNSLWYGGCNRISCCSYNNPPWFCRELDGIFSNDIELRVCANQDTSDEDVPLEIVELYVQ